MLTLRPPFMLTGWASFISAQRSALNSGSNFQSKPAAEFVILLLHPVEK